MTENVAHKVACFKRLGNATCQVAVNVSGRDFMQPEALLRLSDTVTHANLSPSLFELELTEGVLMRDAEAGRRSTL